MSQGEREALRGEIGTLERFLRELSADDEIERIQYEHRLAKARARLAAVESEPQPQSLPITFRGDPVEGARSIDASFAAQAVKAFVEATETVAASVLSDELKGRGRLPGSGARSLRIVDTTQGSFGFELELPPPEPGDGLSLEAGDSKTSPEADPYALAITTTLTLLDEAARDDEEAISDLVAEVHPRAAAKVRAFAKVLADHRALFATAFAGKEVRFDDEAQARRVVESLNDEEISEETVSHRGTLLGVLPLSRTFEARLSDGSTIKGKADRSIENISAFKKRWENVEARLRFRRVRVRAEVRHALVAAEDLTSDENG